MTIATVGTGGARSCWSSYVSEVPVWKTTYRLVLPTGGAPVLQGWAVVDNTIGEDWNDVELSLVAARRSRSSSRCRSRSTPSGRSSACRASTVQSAAGAPGNVDREERATRCGSTRRRRDLTGRIAQPGACRAGRGRRRDGRHRRRAGGGAATARPPAAPAPIDRAMVEERLAGMQASAQGQNLGDLFEYRVDGRDHDSQEPVGAGADLRAESGSSACRSGTSAPAARGRCAASG